MAIRNLADVELFGDRDTLIKTKATYFGTFDSGSDEWHAARATGIGGSEVGTICGLNKWESPYSLWAKKTGKIPQSFEPNEAMEWGTRLEPVILEKFADSHPELLTLTNVGTWTHCDRDWQVANPDGIYLSEKLVNGIIEVKTAQYEDDWSDGVPRHYETQVQWYLQTFGFEHAYVIALFHGNRYREYEVFASPLAQEYALQQVDRFRTYLETDTEPDFDGALATYNTVRALHPEIDATAEVELGFLGEQYFTAEKAYKDAEARLNEMKSRILDGMGDAKRGNVHGIWTFSRQARGAGTPYLTVKRG